MHTTKTTLFIFLLSTTLLSTAACTRHEVELKPVEIKPIHITVDVNVKIDRALDDFFGDLDEQAVKEAEKQLEQTN